MREEPTIKKFLLKKYPPSEYMDCPVPKHHWEDIEDYAQIYAEWHLEKKEDGWIAYDWNNIESRPKETGKYFIHRKDGKVHWETWNGSGWAYNGNVITHYKQVNPPNLIP